VGCRGSRNAERSKFGFSQVVVTFKDGTDIYFARQLVNERLSTVELSSEIERPKMAGVDGARRGAATMSSPAKATMSRNCARSTTGSSSEDAHREGRGGINVGAGMKAVPGADRTEPAHQIQADVRTRS